ncbi:Oxidoreductase [Lysobacter dokdonensis DS-58]|uniref:Oxidoreductase n=1 Tax=Lysobacter dokdonensis DS-58 TaxID=1300345 RepID=A0A0A2WLU4_9GAMM|nr:FAD-dependent oxidoreductase [Lysobacter dokdonensis]KGQ19667.1 Oxidoreductase [Lysobacter dokdonensis DS-58]
MDLKSGYPYWAVKNGLMATFPRLRDDASCDVAIIGGGITGALIAREFAAHGYDTLVLEQRDIAWGSTAASTALLQYEIDTHLVDLAERYGADAAILAYGACNTAVEQLTDLAHEVRDVGFARVASLYYASRKRDVPAMRDEHAARAHIGLDVQWLDAGAIRERYGFDSPAAILSRQAGRVDPYRLASRLFKRLEKRGVRIHDRTVVTAMHPTSRRVVLDCDCGARIDAKHVVIAAGYASQHWLDKRVAKNRSSYAYITDPFDAGMLGAFDDTIAWETARPYLYLRNTEDGRLLVGGEDDACDVPSRRDKRVDKKARKLVERTRELLPHLDPRPAFSWAGTFAETEDGLPFFGPHAQHGPRVQFAMAYGGNGITYSMIGAGLLRAHVERRAHPLKRLFGFGRLS